MIITDLIRDLKMYKLPEDFFIYLDRKCGLITIDPENFDIVKKLKNIKIYLGDRPNLNILSTLPNLEWIHLTSIGSDKLIGINKNIKITNSSGIMEESVTSTILSFMFMLSRNMGKILQLRNPNRYDVDTFTPIQEVFNQSILIVGMGRIGHNLKKVCKSMNMKICGITTTSKHTLKDLPDIINKFDFVINLLPLTDKTKGIFNKNIFNNMQQTAFFINVGRGQTVIEFDLIEALTEEIIAGAGLDVFEIEPLPENSPLWNLQNVILTPHIAGYSDKYWSMACQLFNDNLNKFLTNKKMRNLIEVSN